MSKNLTELQRIQLNALMIYDPFNPEAEMVFTLKQIIWETKEDFFKKSQFLFLKDLKIVENVLHRKIREIYKNNVFSVDCYFDTHSYYSGSVYYHMRNLIITICFQLNNDLILKYINCRLYE